MNIPKPTDHQGHFSPYGKDCSTSSDYAAYDPKRFWMTAGWNRALAMMVRQSPICFKCQEREWFYEGYDAALEWLAHQDMRQKQALGQLLNDNTLSGEDRNAA